MAEATYNPPETDFDPQAASGGRAKFLIGGLILLAAVGYLIVSSLLTQQEYFITVDDLVTRQDEFVDSSRKIRVSGAVVGDTIDYDGQTLTFDIVHLSSDASQLEESTSSGLSEALELAVSDPNASRVTVILYDEPQPDLLQHQAQAIVTGNLSEDGNFYADELLLKCPTRYEEAVPEQVSSTE